MIYLYDESCGRTTSFSDAKLFIAYLVEDLWGTRYNNLLTRQKLSENDVFRERVIYPEDGKTHIFEVPRDIIIIDEDNRLLNIRDFRPDPDVDYSGIYNAWREEQRQAILRERSKKQGKRHRKGYGKCRWKRKVSKFTAIEPELHDFSTRVQHFNRIYNDGGKKPYIYTDCFVKIENNWKSNSKTKRQYMWHKPRHTDYMERNTKCTKSYLQMFPLENP